MAISRKPKTPEQTTADVNIDALIAKGGSVAQVTSTTETAPSKGEDARSAETTAFTLRVPNEILLPLDAHRKKQSYKVPRQQWILEAIMQRLEREMLPYASQDD